MKVLIVDDIEMARLNIKKALARENIDSIEAHNAGEAIQLIKHYNDIRVITLDLHMDDRVDSGLFALEEIRKITKGVKIIIITAFSDDKNFIEAMRKGADCFLTKPVDLNALTEWVKENIKDYHIG